MPSVPLDECQGLANRSCDVRRSQICGIEDNSQAQEFTTITKHKSNLKSGQAYHRARLSSGLSYYKVTSSAARSFASAHNVHLFGGHGPILLTRIPSKLDSTTSTKPPILPVKLFNRSCVRSHDSVSSFSWWLRLPTGDFGASLLKLWRWSSGRLRCTTRRQRADG